MLWIVILILVSAIISILYKAGEAEDRLMHTIITLELKEEERLEKRSIYSEKYYDDNREVILEKARLKRKQQKWII